MAIPVIIAENQTAGAVFLSRLGLTVPASGTLTLTDYAFEDEIRSDEDLQSAVVAGNILLNFGQGALTQGESLKFFNLVTLEVRIPVRALSDTNVGSLSGTTTVDSVSLVADDRVLLTNQTTATQNGIWVVKAGAWQRPDDFGIGQSASMALIAVDEGTTYAEQVWQCTTTLGSDVIGTNNLSFQQISGGGGGDTLQTAYDAGNTITTASSRDIAFTLTSGDFTVDAGTVTFGGTTPQTDFTIDTGTLSIDSTDTTNLTMTANDAADKTLGISASNSGAGDGLLAFSSDGTTEMDAGGDLSLNSSGGNINVGNDADTGDINIGTGAAARNIDLGNNTGATDVDILAGSGGVTVDSSGGSITMEADAASSWNVTGGGLALSTTTSGDITTNSAGATDFQSAGNLTIDSASGNLGLGTDADDGDINIGTGTTTGRDITIGNTTGDTSVTIEATATGQVTIDSPNTTLTGNLVVEGTTTTIHSEEVNVRDNFLYLNADYTTATGKEGGLVINYLPTATTDTVNGAFVAAVPATSNATVVTSGTATFSAGDLIQIDGANDQGNDGLYEVLSHVGTTLTIKGIGLTAAAVPFVQNDFTADTTVQGGITKVNVSAIQTDTSGVWQVENSDTTTGWTWQTLVTSGSGGTLTLQNAYVGGNTITTSAGNGNVTIAGDQTLNVTTTGGLDVDSSADFDVSGFDVQMTGTNGFSIDGTDASNVSVTGGDLTLSTITSGEVLIDGQGGVEINSAGGAIDIGNDANAQDINMGTGAAARSITIGNNTGATGVVIDSGTEQVEIDGVTYYGVSSGNPTPTASGFQDGDKYYDTGIDKEMRYDATRSKWLSVETAYIQTGRNFNTAPGQYYRGINGLVMSATTGYPAFHDGTVVAFGYTRDDSDAATFEIVSGGTNVATLASSAVKGKDNALNGDFSEDDVLAIRNASGSNTTTDVMAWVAVKWRG